MKNIEKLYNLFLILIIFFCIHNNFHQTVSAEENLITIHYVDINGNENFSVIQDAIDYATTGDIIIVKSGLYFENIVIDKTIILRGDNNKNTIIDGRGAGNVIKINAKNIEINNFSIQNSGIYFPNSGINCTSDNNTISNNIINNCFYGITLYRSCNNNFEFNIIKENKNCGIYMKNSSINSFINNTIFNHTYNGIGIYSNSNNNSIKNNILYNNGYCAINIKISSQNLITNNNISNNNIGIHYPKNKNTIIENIFYNNRIDIDEELPTPGFELYIIVISFLTYIFIFSRKKSK